MARAKKADAKKKTGKTAKETDSKPETPERTEETAQEEAAERAEETAQEEAAEQAEEADQEAAEQAEETAREAEEEQAEEAAQEAAEEQAEEAAQEAAEQDSSDEFAKLPNPCVYCGPSVKGVARQYTTYQGGIPDALRKFIEERPEALGLIVSTGRFQAMRRHLETPGTPEAELYKAVKAGL